MSILTCTIITIIIIHTDGLARLYLLSYLFSQLLCGVIAMVAHYIQHCIKAIGKSTPQRSWCVINTGRDIFTNLKYLIYALATQTPYLRTWRGF